MRIVNPTAVLGEDKACDYLRTKEKHTILERNFRQGYGEIDIIAIDKSEKEPVLAFIEVKTRKSNAYGTPFEAITYYKMQSLLKTAQYYAMTHKKLPEALRIDAVSVILHHDNTVREIVLMKNISG